ADEAIDRCSRGLRRPDPGERWARSYLQVLTALGLFLKGDLEASSTAARESLRLKNEVGDITGIAYCLEMLAFLAAAGRQHKRTAWLLGAADALWERTGKRFGGETALESLHQQAESTARDGLGPRQYQSLFRDGAGRELSLTVELATREAGQAPAPVPGSLTKREREIAALVCDSLTNGQIAQRLVISRRTVDSHVASIYAKLGLSSRAQLVNWLIQQLGGRGRSRRRGQPASGAPEAKNLSRLNGPAGRPCPAVSPDADSVTAISPSGPQTTSQARSSPPTIGWSASTPLSSTQTRTPRRRPPQAHCGVTGSSEATPNPSSGTWSTGTPRRVRRKCPRWGRRHGGTPVTRRLRGPGPARREPARPAGWRPSPRSGPPPPPRWPPPRWPARPPAAPGPG
ncbi:MAG TPA: LuxR C-terminal-related transcriptional regulator, partial [Trebonia sp.]